MKKRYLGIFLIVISMVVLSACGEKSEEDVVEKLSETLEEMDGYKAEAEMAMKTGQEEQRFTIDIWHQKDDYYRVKLGHAEDDKGSQIILKNDDGVFVLTPALERSFKFQSEWPQNSSQPYLYQSLVQDILNDEEASFEATETHYAFKTKTNYQNNTNLPYQQILFDKKTFFPTAVQVLDVDDQAVVEVQFNAFDTAVSFEADDFAMEKNMETNGDAPTFSSNNEEEVFTVLHPLYTAGAEAIDQKEMEFDNGKRVILTYGGQKDFTLVQEMRTDVPTLTTPEAVDGEIVNLGFTVGALTDSTIQWNHEGIDYTLASDSLTKDELIEVAQSVRGQEIK
ncbi:LolA family protein [Oceanobacillus alkalisoli]|uniref:LolA family protein n=1 Tax=Oceanobacillus alkalisoli TaxID=2925113 RepID=UPI001EE42859|nr:outer membrane lipoprotein carrier protein LolA [Oceanobacillus alkalisoli]MCG5104833.1 outer membrane lipoprotein carrier protein LolA [Oceanobacillus alkalisoli]